MTELLTAAQMRAVEQAAVESGEITGLELMERAGTGVVEAVIEEWPELARGTHRAVVFCGPGNNGGDGFVVARLLKGRGWAVEVFLYGDAEKLPPDARVNYELWGEVGEVRPFGAWAGRKWGCDLVVDALFGTGLTRALHDFGELFWNLGDMVDCFDVEFGHPWGRPAIVAVDVPSGLCADSGRAFPQEDTHSPLLARAHLTVTFHRAKLGHYLADGPENSGKVVTKSIGLEAEGSDQPRNGENRLPGGAVGRCPAVPPAELVEFEPGDGFIFDKFDGHKYTHGHALILSGPSGKGGAARLAARGALRIGAGLVTVGCPPEAVVENAAQLTAIMLAPVADAGVLGALLKDGRKNAICVGPGFGTSERELEMVEVILGAGRATVLDADALSLLARGPALMGLLHEGCVLTPHAGEFARLFPDIAERLDAPATRGPAYSKVDATREAAARAGCTVLFKGPDTVIADPSGRCGVNSAAYDRAAPWLATAGSGDVLAGMIAGLLARGFAPMQAAETAAWLHVESALSFGPGLIAEDLPEELPAVFRSLGP